ncbi:hypothetical protein FK268_11260 [Tsukamurella sputi]|uniref:Uncharacterized protein n=1 Tax=Tsukamurella sputi TaxID=2591848 RepID=A0A5C5RNE3_9ACTN|nr:hypothetical protein [Tsukamurella sputi]TWS24182.1 hypothetical protein FK268_11260 [Tsukamurella sputi]
MTEPSDFPTIDPYVTFAFSLPAEKRRNLGRLLESLVTRDDGGWTIPNLTADDFLRRHRDYLRTLVEDDYGDTFRPEE